MQCPQQLMEPSPTIDHTLRFKANINIYEKLKITPCILLDHHGLRLDINSNRKFPNSWKLNNSLVNEKWTKTEIKKLQTF